MAADKSSPFRIAVYGDLDLVGDALIKLPFVRALRLGFPAAGITWIAGRGKSAFAGVLAPLVVGLLDRVLEGTGVGARLRAALGEPRLDLLIDTQSGLATAWALRKLGARRSVSAAAWGLAGNPPRLDINPSRHLATRLLGVVELITGQPVGPPGRLALPAEAVALAGRLLPAGPRYVAQVLGAGGKHKAWPEERHVALARALLARGEVPVMILGPDEAARHAALVAALPDARFPLQIAQAGGDAASPPLTIALAMRCAAAVAADCGGGHMMAAAGIPLVSLFGPTDPAKFAPSSPDPTILRAQDFGLRAQDFGGAGMAAIPVAAVLAALAERTDQ